MFMSIVVNLDKYRIKRPIFNGKKPQPIVSNNCIYDIKRTSQQACCVCWYIRSSLNVQTTRYLVDFV